MKYVALVGDMREGYVAVGPFDSKIKADKHTQEDRTETKVYIVELKEAQVDLDAEWHEDPHVVLAGTPVDGFTVYGPFGSDDEASYYGERYTPGEFQTLPMAVPCPSCECRTFGTQGGEDAMMLNGKYICTTCVHRLPPLDDLLAHNDRLVRGANGE